MTDPNLDCGGRCTGACCRFLLVDLSGADHARWFVLHSGRVYRNELNGRLYGLIEKKCAALTDGGKCALYGTPRRPRMCGEFFCEMMPKLTDVTGEMLG